MLGCITLRLRLKMNDAINTRHGSKTTKVCQEADELNFDMDLKRISTSPMRIIRHNICNAELQINICDV